MNTIGVNRKFIQRMAKIAAGLYLLITVLAIFTHFYVPGELIVAGDASKTLSLIAAVSRLVMTTIHGFNVLNKIFVLVLLSGTGYLSVFDPDELNALVMFFLNGYTYGFGIGIVFLGLHASLLGYLIFVSGYFPKFLGVLFVLASLGYFIDSFLLLLLPSYVPGQPFIAIPIALAEIAFPLWLLIKGVNTLRWQKHVPETTSYNK
jgi:uncharacterized protein DUF4386